MTIPFKAFFCLTLVDKLGVWSDIKLLAIGYVLADEVAEGQRSQWPQPQEPQILEQPRPIGSNDVYCLRLFRVWKRLEAILQQLNDHPKTTQYR